MPPVHSPPYSGVKVGDARNLSTNCCSRGSDGELTCSWNPKLLGPVARRAGRAGFCRPRRAGWPRRLRCCCGWRRTRRPAPMMTAAAAAMAPMVIRFRRRSARCCCARWLQPARGRPAFPSSCSAPGLPSSLDCLRTDTFGLPVSGEGHAASRLARAGWTRAGAGAACRVRRCLAGRALGGQLELLTVNVPVMPFWAWPGTGHR